MQHSALLAFLLPWHSQDPDVKLGMNVFPLLASGFFGKQLCRQLWSSLGLVARWSSWWDCGWTSAPPARDFLLTHDAVEYFCLMCLNLLGILPIYPFMVIKMTFLYPSQTFFCLPCSLYSYTSLPFLHELSFGQSPSSSARCKTYLKESRLFCSQKTWDCWWIPLQQLHVDSAEPVVLIMSKALLIFVSSTCQMLWRGTLCYFRGEDWRSLYWKFQKIKTIQWQRNQLS